MHTSRYVWSRHSDISLVFLIDLSASAPDVKLLLRQDNGDPVGNQMEDLLMAYLF